MRQTNNKRCRKIPDKKTNYKNDTTEGAELTRTNIGMFLVGATATVADDNDSNDDED